MKTYKFKLRFFPLLFQWPEPFPYCFREIFTLDVENILFVYVEFIQREALGEYFAIILSSQKPVNLLILWKLWQYILFCFLLKIAVEN